MARTLRASTFNGDEGNLSSGGERLMKTGGDGSKA
jgi:hypothetical protein